MTLGTVLVLADDMKPNAFSDELKTHWVSQCEGMVQLNVLLQAVDEVTVYDCQEDLETELMARPPHDKLYLSYLAAMIDFANGEYSKYQNTMEMFNSQYGEFMRWYADSYRPADAL
ncbi:MAG: hypothetical protein LUD69_09060 [Oscillospiraceae bacterium]|nr:hypothetical protein [Oscillospiraceae bacterium]